jgi:hypothetical protein
VHQQHVSDEAKYSRHMDEEEDNEDMNEREASPEAITRNNGQAETGKKILNTEEDGR